MTTPLTHAEATELAGLYVLDALDPAERAQVDTHIASCPLAHDEFAEVGGVVPGLATLADPAGAPASLKNKVMADYRAGAGARVWDMSPAAPRPPARRSWSGWAAAGIAVLLLAVTAGWAYTAQQRADLEAQHSQVLGQAITIMSTPGSSVALMHGTGTATGAKGFAAVNPFGDGVLILVDLPSAPPGRTYQAWYIRGGLPASVGLVSVDTDGFAFLPLPLPLDRPGVIALTLEPAGGSTLPTADPIVSGEVDQGPHTTGGRQSFAAS